MNANNWDLPLPPQGMMMPEKPQQIALAIWSIIAIAYVVYALVQWYRTRSPLAILLFLGAAIAYLNEPIVDLLGLVWHPRINQSVALNTFGPVPLWGWICYMIFWGSMPYLVLRLAQRGITRKVFWTAVLGWFALDFAMEAPLIPLGLYYYYGAPPFVFLGLPAYWLTINTLGPLSTVALLLRAPQLFQGWRLCLVPLLPMTTDAMASLGSGWPIFSALNTPGVSSGVKWIAGALTILLGLIIMDGLSRLICRYEEGGTTT